MINKLVTIIALAQQEENAIAQQFQPSMASLFIRTVISLAIVLVLTYLVIKVIKKQQDVQQKLQNSQKGWIRIYDYQALAPNRGIYLIELFSKIYLVGSSESNINILKEVPADDEEWLAYREELEKTPGVIPAGLLGLLKQKTDQFRIKKAETFQQELSTQLKKEVDDQRERTHRLYLSTLGRDKDGE